MNEEAIRAQLAAALQELYRRAQRIFGVASTRYAERLASRWTAALVRQPPDEAVARLILDELIGPGPAAMPAFWYSELGTAIARAGAIPEAVSGAVAAAILGISRQRAHELVKGGKLRSTRPVDGTPMIAGESILARLRGMVL